MMGTLVVIIFRGGWSFYLKYCAKALRVNVTLDKHSEIFKGFG